MRYSILMLVAFLSLVGFKNVPSDLIQSPNTLVIQLQDFSSEKNLSIYELFKNDKNILVVNSCDVLGMVVLDIKENSIMSKAEGKAYVQVKIQDVLSESGYVLREDLNTYQVLMDCRAEMQRQLDPTSK